MMQRILILIAAVFAMNGCAHEPLTEGQKIEREFARAERKAEREDEIRTKVLNCHEKGQILWYKGWARIHPRGLIDHKTGEVRIPRHAMPSEFICASTGEVQRALREAGYIF